MAVPRVPVLVKTPLELRTVTFDFADKLAGSDTCTGTPTLVYPAGLTEVVSTRSGNKVNSRMSGGTNETIYRIVCRCGTTNGDTLSLQVDILVDVDAN